MKNGFGLRSGLLSATCQVQGSRCLCVLWHIFTSWSGDSSEAVLLMYVVLMVLILSYWIMSLFQGCWWCNAWWQERKLRWGNVRTSSDKSGRPTQSWLAGLGLCSPGTHRSLSRKIIKLWRARRQWPQDHWDIDGWMEDACIFFPVIQMWNYQVAFLDTIPQQQPLPSAFVLGALYCLIPFFLGI